MTLLEILDIPTAGLPVPLTLSGNEITPASRAAGTQGDGLTGPYAGSSIGVWEATTNLVTNGGFETSTTGYTPINCTITRSGAQFKFGSFSGLITPSATSYYVSNGITISGATTGLVYTFSVWIYGTGSIVGKALQLLIDETGGASGLGRTTQAITILAGWNRYSATRTVVENDRTGMNILVYDGNNTYVSGDLLYVDGVQLEAQPIATPYVHTDGGTASRTAATPQMPITGRLAITQGWVAIGLRMGWASAGTAPDANTTAFDLRSAANGQMVQIRWSGTQWLFVSGGAPTISLTPSAFVNGTITTLLMSWTNTGALYKASVDGAPFTEDVGATIPDFVSVLWIGNNAVSSARAIDSTVTFVATGRHYLTDADAADLNNIARNNRIDSRLEDLPGGATFKWPSENWREGMAL